MAMLGKRRPPRQHSGHSGLARSAPAVPASKPSVLDEAVGADSVTIERLAHDGRGVAHLASGKTVFVDHALPGEQGVIAVHRNRKRYDEAHLKSVTHASTQRTTPICEHFGHCGGCDLQHLAVTAQRDHKRQVIKELFARQGITVDVPIELLAGESDAYRRRARLGVKVDGDGRVLLGFRARHSHRLVDIKGCPVLVPPLQALLAPLREHLERLQAPRYIGHIELIATAETSMVVVRQLREHLHDKACWERFAAEHGVVLGTWLGRETPELHWHGAPPHLVDRLGEVALSFQPGDFLQVNAEVNRQMVATVSEWLAGEPGQCVLDLFAGIGNFSLPLAAQGAHVHAVEGSAAMVERLQANASANRLDVSAEQVDLSQLQAVEALLCHSGEANSAPGARPVVERDGGSHGAWNGSWNSSWNRAWNSVVVDPPRSGAESVCRALSRRPPPRVVYVSCDPATLARDAAQLVHAGYRIARMAVADMFVHTAHMETLVLFEHSG
ncbi:23S rRNA (uracil(1939)-C(5))-methyltransferase RlmD [Halomonas sp. Bachu 37]|uniref:23S rRNA (uracil(1939)-C(5))-methyltransferase RlmD n=1 Tax=Halomonas kashgarensis TaxID=3084920 RepID=UPI003217513B